MAGLRFTAQITEEALAATTAETLIQVIAPSNQRVKVLGWGIFFDGTSVSAEPVQVRLTGGTVAGTASTTLTTVGANGSCRVTNGATETIQSVAKSDFTVEPTVAIVYDAIEVHPQSGYEVKYPVGQEMIVIGGSFVAIEATAPANVNCRAKLICEE